MKTNRILYWIFTILLALFMIFSGSMYLSKSKMIMDGFATLGYPIYFAMLLGTAKILGAIGLVQNVWKKAQEWAYAGFTFTFIGATWSHLSTNTSFYPPLIALIILILSYWFRSKLHTANK